MNGSQALTKTLRQTNSPFVAGRFDMAGGGGGGASTPVGRGAQRGEDEDLQTGQKEGGAG